MKFFQKRGVAVAVMLLAIAASIAWGQYKKPAALPKVKYETWVCDDADLLSSATKRSIEQYNDKWDSAYYALCAVATVKSTRGWDSDDYTSTLGEKWGLGSKDLLLVLVGASGGPTWYINGGDTIMDAIRGTSAEEQIKSALDGRVYSEDWDGAVAALLPVLDQIYQQRLGAASDFAYSYDDGSYDSGWQDTAGTGSVLKKFLIVLLIVFVLWIVLDRLRYNRYRRRSTASAVGSAVRYYPVFWGRSAYRAPRPPVSGYRPSGGVRPSGGTRPGTGGGHTRPSSGSFGSRGGFGGGSRGSFTRSSGGVTRGGGFSLGGGPSRGGRGGGFGSRGGFGGGRR